MYSHCTVHVLVSQSTVEGILRRTVYTPFISIGPFMLWTTVPGPSTGMEALIAGRTQRSVLLAGSEQVPPSLQQAPAGANTSGYFVQIRLPFLPCVGPSQRVCGESAV